MPQALTKKRLLLCEGPDDKFFFESLIHSRALPDFQVCHNHEWNGRTGGIDGFVHSLKAIHAFTGFGNLSGILLVADNDVMADVWENSFRKVQRAITDNGYTAPPTIDQVGEISGKAVAIVLVPRAEELGDLETLALPAIHEKWPKARICVEFFLRCTGALKLFRGARWTKRSSVSKARARAAAVGFHEPDPYKGIGYLFSSGDLLSTHTCFDNIANSLRNFGTTIAP